jgi:primosomal protein N' (replication factor Y)
MFVRVAIQIPSAKTFTYAVPESLASAVAVGMRAVVPFGRRRVTGFIVELMSEAACDQTVRDILELPDPEPLFGARDLAFYGWIAEYYLHPLGKVLGELLPGGLGIRSERRYLPVTATVDPALAGCLSVFQQRILEHLSRHPRGLSARSLARLSGKQELHGDLRILVAAGHVAVKDQVNRPAGRPRQEPWVALVRRQDDGTGLTAVQRSLVACLEQHGDMPARRLLGLAKASPATLKRLEARGIIQRFGREVRREAKQAPPIGGRTGSITLNAAQDAALSEICRCLETGGFCPCLLHGVTGSGKTEVYLQSIAEVLSGPGTALYLVPEIALTQQLLTRIRERFPDQEIAVLHSAISRGARYDQWRGIRRGAARIVVGARSALFAPLPNLRLIVVDEEHDPSYKQDDRLRYHARDLALVKGKLSGATVLLGSATPAVQSFYHAAQGRYRLLTLPDRVDDRPLPTIEVVDLRTERNEQGQTPLFSRTLTDAIRQTLAERRQTLLFLNRRGFHTYLFCPDCGRPLVCPGCDIALTLHAAAGVLKCHHCDYTTGVAATCPACGGGRIRSHGTGTERVEQEARAQFPEARIARMDSDTTSRRGDSERLLHAFDRGEIDILVGTQMITKGHDFPGITLVGVIAADASLNIPDFRAAERTFQILTQVSGRSGRGDDPGRVVIQTFNPDHYVVRRAREHDYAGFFADELPLRRQLAFPPFSRLVGLHLSSPRREQGMRAAAAFGARARELAGGLGGGGLDVLGPAESPLAKIRGRYRWQLLLRGRNSSLLHRLVQQLRESGEGPGIEVQVDVDPVNFM